MAEQPTGTVTLLFTDIEGSTEMLRALGRPNYVEALGVHRQIVRGAVARHDGTEVEMQGDSFFFVFRSARAGVSAAAVAQRELAEHHWPTRPIHVRIGVHTGEPERTEEGLYAGLDVHRAARIMSIGHGDQILLSARTTDLVAEDLPDGLSLRRLGTFRLKDFTRPEEVSQLDVEGLRTEFPALRAEKASTGRSPRRIVLAALVVAALVAAAAVAAVVLAGGNVGPRSDVVVAIDPGHAHVTARVAVGSSPRSIAAGSGAVWVVNAADATMSEVSAAGAFVRTFGTGGSPVVVATGGGLLWVVNGDRSIVRLDPRTLRVLNEYEPRLPVYQSVGGQTSLTAQGSELWGTMQARLVRIDGVRGAPRVSGLPGPDWGPLAVLDGSLWESQINTLYHLSATGRIISTLSFPQGAVATGNGYVWAANPDAGVVAQIDPRTTAIVRTVTVGAGPTGLTFGGGSLWVCSEDGTVTRIDPIAGRPIATIRVGGSPQAIAYGFGRVWVAVS